jgi:iron complex transport system substrate-binding protein
VRLVSIAPSNTEIVQSLGAEDQLVGTTVLSPLDTAKVGGWTSVDCDAVENVNPDLVLACDWLQGDAVEDLRGRGFDVLHLRPRTLEDVLDSFLEVGSCLGVPERAESLVSRFRRTLNDVDIDGRVYCEEWTDPPMASGNWVPGLVEGAGAEYLVEEGERSREVSARELEAFDPDHIFLNVCGAGRNVSPETVLEREGWQDVEAVSSADVTALDDSILNQPSPRLLEGVRAISREL